jgi:hypothetical protein
MFLYFDLPANGQKHLRLKYLKAPANTLTGLAVSQPWGHGLKLSGDV